MASSAPLDLKIKALEGVKITDDIFKAAAQVFTNNYGVWGPLAEEKLGSFAKQGQRVRMSPKRIQEQCLPKTCRNTFVGAFTGDKLAGYVFASRWTYEGRSVCWITQLCVKAEFRRLKIATKLLEKLREGEADLGFGILSSHPGAILAALRAFGRGLEEVDQSMAKQHAKDIMASSPVGYVRDARLHGSLFEASPEEGVVSCADTDFFVDHTEPLEVLEGILKQGRPWPFGRLPEGHEFLVLVKARDM